MPIENKINNLKILDDILSQYNITVDLNKKPDPDEPSDEDNEPVKDNE